MSLKLQAIYNFFKPMKETVTWANGVDEVCVGWQYASGFCRYYERKGNIYQEWADCTRGDQMPEEIDRGRIAAALREWNAAQNSWVRANAELQEVIPHGVMVLHCLPGEAGKKDVVFWTHQKCEGRNSIFSGAGRQEQAVSEGMHGVVIEAPAPRDEYLPRLHGEQS